MRSFANYEIRWNPAHPDEGAEMDGIEHPHRQVVTAEKAIDGDWVLVLYAKGRAYYRGAFASSGYAAATFEVYHLTADLGNNKWEAERLVEFPARVKKAP